MCSRKIAPRFDMREAAEFLFYQFALRAFAAAVGAKDNNVHERLPSCLFILPDW